MSDSQRAMGADRVFTICAWIMGGMGFLLPVMIIGFLFVKGMGMMSPHFLLTSPSGFPLGTAGGILPAIQGTLALVGIGLLVAFPTGVGGALYLTEYGKNQFLLKLMRFAIECLAGIPSIIYGLFGYAFLVVFVSLKVSLLAGGLTLGLMMFPIILVGTQEALLAVEWPLREAALAMGVNRSYLIRRVLLKKAWPGIIAATVLTAGHAMGSAAPVLYTASTILNTTGIRLDAPVMTLSTHLYYLVSQALSFDHAFGTALVLVMILLAVNFISLYLKRLSEH